MASVSWASVSAYGFSLIYYIQIRDHALAAIEAAMGRYLDVNFDHARLLEEVRGLLFVFYFNQNFCRREFLALYDFPIRLSINLEIRKIDWEVMGFDLSRDSIMKNARYYRMLEQRSKAKKERILRCGPFSGTDHVRGEELEYAI